MNKTSKRILWIISSLSFIGVCFSYPYLPEQIPIHWDVNWKVDDWADKNFIFIIGLMPIAILLLLEILPKIDPRRENYKKNGKSYDMLQLAFVFLMIILSWATVASALWKNFSINKILPAFMGIIFIVLGNYMPIIKSNYFVGIKNPWTLANDLVWRKTHKAGGYVFAISGIFMVFMSIIQNTVFNYFSFGVLILGILGINLYSYVLYRKINKNMK